MRDTLLQELRSVYENANPLRPECLGQRQDKPNCWRERGWNASRTRRAKLPCRGLGAPDTTYCALNQIEANIASLGVGAGATSTKGLIAARDGHVRGMPLERLASCRTGKAPESRTVYVWTTCGSGDLYAAFSPVAMTARAPTSRA